MRRKTDKERTSEELREKISFLKEMAIKLAEMEYKVPYGRFRDRDGVEKYDAPDGIGLFKMIGNGESVFLGTTGPIIEGEYMAIGGEYEVSEKEMSALREYIKELEKMAKKKERQEARRAKRDKVER